MRTPLERVCGRPSLEPSLISIFSHTAVGGKRRPGLRRPFIPGRKAPTSRFHVAVQARASAAAPFVISRSPPCRKAAGARCAQGPQDGFLRVFQLVF